MEWFLLLAGSSSSIQFLISIILGLCQVVALRTDDVYHYKEEEGKMVEWLVERASLPISGNFEFFGFVLFFLKINYKLSDLQNIRECCIC